MEVVILKTVPYLARIIKSRDEGISENALLKARILELKKLVEENSNTTQSSAPLKDCLEDFSVTIFNHRAISGKKS